MGNGLPETFRTADATANWIIRTLNGNIVLGLPLGLGKANQIANALYACAVADPSIRLRIFTALTLEKPSYRSELERRFLEPVIERLFGGYPALEYATALRRGTLPRNIEVNEFFLLAGRWLGVPRAQQAYVSVGYAEAAAVVAARGVNVIAQLVARQGQGSALRYSLSCNTDLTLDMLQARTRGEAKFLLIGQVNSELPFMPGEGDLPASAFDAILDDPAADFSLFAPPKEPISLPEYAAGLHIARLIPDGGTLQIGIGEEGDAAVHALILRQRENAAFRQALHRLGALADSSGHLEPFKTGLYAATEMLVDGLLSLKDAGVLKREVDGAIVHAAFFLGPKSFYRALREMPERERAKFQMKAVSFTNQLYGDEEAKRAARANARFINNAMIATLLGEAASDTLEEGRVVSGVGGQHNFVTQASALPGARSVLTLKATRKSAGRVTSNICWSYGHTTIPRHLRDIFVTEYGVADLRGKADAECIAAMLAIADSRFQAELLRQAKAAGKIAKAYEIPAAQRNNSPERIAQALAPLREHGLLPLFPLGTDFTETEQRLIPALALLNEAAQSKRSLLALALRGWRNGSTPSESAALARLGLDLPKSAIDRFYRVLVAAALADSR